MLKTTHTHKHTSSHRAPGGVRPINVNRHADDGAAVAASARMGVGSHRAASSGGGGAGLQRLQSASARMGGDGARYDGGGFDSLCAK